MSLVPRPDRPPSSRIELRSDTAAPTLTIRPVSTVTGWLEMVAALAVAGVVALFWWVLEPEAQLGWILLGGGGVFVAMLIRDGVRQAFGGDRLAVGIDGLHRRALRGGEDVTPFDDILEIRLEKESIDATPFRSLRMLPFWLLAQSSAQTFRLCVERRDRSPLRLAAGLGHDEATMSWLASWLRAQLAAADPGRKAHTDPVEK